MGTIPFHDSGRFYIHCDSTVFCKKKIWLGGPIAMLIHKDSVDSLLEDFIAQYHRQPNNNDVILTQILTENDYVCRDPMLGFENEEGGTTFGI